jgi:hypothetical protein
VITRLVWVVWAAMTLALVACVALYTYNMPLAEDWHMVSPLTGNEPSLWDWAWAQNNEHRLPLPRLLLLGVLALVPDFRAGMLASIAVMAVAAALLIRALSRARGGRLRFTDAFIPIALLHIGNWENYMWAWELCFVLSAAIALLLLPAMSATDLWSSRPRALAVAVCVAALPLCGANGMAFVAPIAAWLAFEAALRLRQAGAPAAIVLTGVATAIAGTIYYFIGYMSATWNPDSPGPVATIKTALKFLALGLGPVVSARAGIWALVMLAIGLPVLFVVLRRVVEATDERRGVALRWLAYLAGVASLAVAFGWGRAGLVPMAGLPDRYVLLAIPGLIWVYFAADSYAGPVLRRGCQVALLLISMVLLPLNTRDGFEWRNWYRTGMQAVIRDIDAGMPRDELVTKHRHFLMAWSPERLAIGMEMLREAGLGPFARLQAPARSATR